MTNLAVAPESGVAVAPLAATLYVVFRVNGSDYMLPSGTVLQMESFTGATPIPGAPPFVIGIVQVRGRVIPVIDLRVLFGGTPGPLTLDNRIVVGQHSERVVGLLVDSAREVLKVTPDQLKPPPPVLNYQAQGYIKAVAQVGARVLMVIDFAGVLGEEATHAD